MSITFDNGYSISKISTGVTMRSLLSAAGQTTYDATTVGNFFSCSLADYNAVFAGYADAVKIGNTDVIFNTAVGDTLRMVVAVGDISFDSNDNFSVAYIG